jgi:hypothetical protein
MKNLVAVAAGCILLLSLSSLHLIRASEDAFVLECHSVFRADTDEKGLTERFGSENVTTERIHLGEGEHEDGTVLFASSAAQRVEILWKDPDLRSRPRWVRIRAEKSLWRTEAGVTLGMSLRELETLNRFPFRLAGFAWDYEGTVLSWGRGTLARPDSASCKVGARLRPEASAPDSRRQALIQQVSGDTEFSSGHPAMQELNPRVYEVWLGYR